MIRTFLLLAFVLLSLVCYVYGLVCLSCNGISQPRHCHTVEECKTHQFCSVERVFNQFNDVLYNLGCHSAEKCTSNLTTGVITSKACHECCGGDLCNSNGCGTSDYPNEAGPLCYNCTNLPKGRFCHRIDVCKNDEVCFTEEVEEFGDIYITSGCRKSVSCHGSVEIGNIRPGNLIGKRSVVKKTAVNHVCSNCCTSTLCNEGCSKYLCNDNWKNCSYLSHHYRICRDEILSKYCQNTCGQCSTYVTTTTVGVSGNGCVDSADNCRLLDERMNMCTDKQLAADLGCFATCHLCNSKTTFPPKSSSTTKSTTPSTTPTPTFIDCLDIITRNPSAATGVYTVTPSRSQKKIAVWCDMDTAGGGWTVFQKRYDGSVDFYQNLSEYVNGFGNISGEFWLGLDNINSLTDGNNNTLRIDITDKDDKHTYEQVSRFNLGLPPYYLLRISDTSTGSVSGIITYYKDQEFSTKDYDRDQRHDINCAVWAHGGFWYNDCIRHANPNGLYDPNGQAFEMSYSTDHGNKALQMKFRRSIT